MWQVVHYAVAVTSFSPPFRVGSGATTVMVTPLTAKCSDGEKLTVRRCNRPNQPWFKWRSPTADPAMMKADELRHWKPTAYQRISFEEEKWWLILAHRCRSQQKLTHANKQGNNKRLHITASNGLQICFGQNFVGKSGHDYIRLSLYRTLFHLDYITFSNTLLSRTVSKTPSQECPLLG